MSSRRTRSFLESLILWMVRILVGLLIGLAIYLVIRSIPKLYRWMGKKNRSVLPALDRVLPGRLLLSPEAIVVSALFWGLVFVIVGVPLLVLIQASNPEGALIALIALSFGGFMMGLGAGRDLVDERELRKRLTAEPPLGDVPDDFVTDKDRQYTRISEPVSVKIDLPPHTPYNPEANAQFLSTLRGLESLLDLEVAASARGFRFAVVVDEDRVDQVESAVRAAFPRASLSIQPLAGRDPLVESPADFTLSHSITAEPGRFFAPIKGLSEFKNTDPLSVILQNVSGLREGESVVLQYLVRPAQFPDWQKLGVERITKDPLSLKNFLSVSGAFGAVFAARGEEREPRFEATEHRTYLEKLEQPAFEVMANVYVAADDKDRRKALSEGLGGALAQFDSGYNALSFAPPSASDHGKARDRRFVPAFPLDQDARLMLLTADELASLWHLPSELVELPGIFAPLPKTAPPPRVAEDVGPGVVIGESLFQDQREPLALAYQDRDTHINIIGSTGMGKSTLMHHVVHQDIERGKGVALIDPHGDLFDRVLKASIPPEREDDVVVFDLSSPKDLVPLGLFDLPKGVSKERAAVAFMKVFEQVFEKKWPTVRTRHVVNFAVRALLDYEGATLSDLPRFFRDASFRQGLVSRVTHKPTREFWQDRFEPLSQASQDRMVFPVLNRLYDFLGNPVVEYVTCQPESLDFESIVNERKVLLVNLRSPELTDTARQTLAQLIISKIQMASWARADLPFKERDLFFLVVDEVQDFTATSLPKLFAEARKYGLSLTVANQYLGQLTGDTLEAVFGNVGTTLVFKLGAKDARSLSLYLKPAFEAADITYLDKFQAVVKARLGGRSRQPFSIMTPQPMGTPSDADARATRVREHSRQAYALPPRPEEEWGGKEEEWPDFPAGNEGDYYE